MSTTLQHGIIQINEGNISWYGDITANWQLIDRKIGEYDAAIAAIPAPANNGTLTIQQNGTTVDTFTANSSSDKTANIQCVDLSTAQTVGGLKTWTSYQTILGTYLNNESSTNARTCLYLVSNRDTINQSGIYVTKFRQNKAQGEMGDNDNQILSIDVLENGVRSNNIFRFTFKGWVNNVPTKVYLEPFSADNQAFLGTSSHPWVDVGTNAINGINPGALSLPGAFVNVDTTNWDLTCSNGQLGSFTPTADGWLMLHVVNSGTSEVNFWIIGGVVRINNKSSANLSANDNSNMFIIPVEKDKTYNIYGNASEYVAGRRIAYCRFMPCQGNV